MDLRLLIALFAGLSYPVASVFPQSPENERWESVLETLLDDEEMSSDAREELMFMYESMHDMPLNINSATREELAQLPFLSYKQIEDIHAYIYMHGPMLTLGELQLTGSLDYSTCRKLREFVYIGPVPERKEKIRIADVLKDGRSELVSQTDIPLYIRDGFRYHSPSELARYPNRAYKGNRLSYSLRYSLNWHNRIRFGFTADKDAGERCVDYWSPYLYVRDMGVLRELALGNFKAQFGLGLLMGGGFSVGKSMAWSSLSGQTQGLKPHSSTQEYGYLRGGGATVGWGHTSFTLLAAYTPLDATLKGDSVISSFKEDGYHRTGLECSKKHDVTLGTLGVNVRYSYRGLRYGGTLLTERLSLPYKGRDRFWGVSADCSINMARYAFAAEVSVSDSKPAVIARQTFRLHNGWGLNLVLRHYSPDYQALHSNALAEANTQNETGVLAEFAHGGNNLKINGYADFFMHPKPRYGASERSNGMDLRMEADQRLGKRDGLYATARFKSKQKDCRYTGRLEYCWTGRYRVRWTHYSRRGAELKTQLFYVRYDFVAEPISNGWALAQSWSRSLNEGRLDLNLSGAVFRTDSYDSRLSVYETGLRYTYNFMSLYGKGLRLAGMVRYKLGQDMQLDIKAGSTYYTDRDEISSAQQRIASNHKEDISVQFIARF